MIKISKITSLDELLFSHTIKEIAEFIDCNPSCVSRWTAKNRNGKKSPVISPDGTMYTPKEKHKDGKGYKGYSK